MNTIYKNLQYMMFERHYICQSPLSPKTNITIDDFDISFKYNNDIIKIFYINDVKIGINHIKDIIKKLDTINYKHAIIIYNKVITSFAKQFLETCEYNIELFSENEL